MGARTMRNVKRTSRGGGGVKGKGTPTVTFGNFFSCFSFAAELMARTFQN